MRLYEPCRQTWAGQSSAWVQVVRVSGSEDRDGWFAVFDVECERWEALYDVALATVTPLVGTYHQNYVVRDGGETFVVRAARKMNAEDVEPRMYPETSVLSALEEASILVPSLVYRSAERRFMVLSYAPGVRVVDSFPMGVGVPGAFVDAVRNAMKELYRIDGQRLGQVLAGSPWPGAAGSTAPKFLSGLLSWLTKVYNDASSDERELMSALGMQANPFTARDFEVTGQDRVLRLCHGDLGRENILVTSDERFHILDWELAVWGDPVWDIASHMHRAAYVPAQVESALGQLLQTCPEWAGSPDNWNDLFVYTKVEQYRSLVLDSLRFARCASEYSPDAIVTHAENYHRKLSAAGLPGASADDVVALFRAAAEKA